MDILMIVLGALLVLASIGSGFAKLAKVPAVMQSMKSVGVKPHQIPILAALDISGGAGLIIGIWNSPLGKLSAFCLTLYFFGAVTSHLRQKHGVSEFAPAFFLALIALVETFLQFGR
ncbi:MAG: hypothetical protein RL590_27 [Actinomycetota bacterium]|jgi:hypothetical protein